MIIKGEKMNVLVVENYSEMSRRAADIVVDLINEKKTVCCWFGDR